MWKAKINIMKTNEEIKTVEKAEERKKKENDRADKQDKYGG
jgi:hypothetical protein